MSRKQRMERRMAERMNNAGKDFHEIWAVDFDGTICVNKYPEIGNPRSTVIDAIKEAQEQGTAIILWTCREGAHLENALRWCAEHGLYFDAVNDNVATTIEKYGNSRKIYAHKYIDDRCFKI